jgi:hypothetical protein
MKIKSKILKESVLKCVTLHKNALSFVGLGAGIFAVF